MERKIAAGICWLAAVGLFLILFFDEFFGFCVTKWIKVAAAVLFFITAYCGLQNIGTILPQERARSVYKNSTILLFGIYLLFLLDIILFDAAFGRSISSIFFCSRSYAADYIKSATNFIPFKTVLLYIRGFLNGKLGLRELFLNLIGNFIVMMPFAFFYPILSGHHRPFWLGLLTVGVFVVVLELLQLIFLTGSADVDDLIFNVAGSAVAFAVLRQPRVSAMMHQKTFGAYPQRNI